MKKLIYILLFFVASAIITSCAFDNYDEPTSFLKGRIMFNGEPVNVSYNDVTFQLWESGWQLHYPIDVVVAQDGSYSALLFDGDYKLIIPEAQGPFRNKINPSTGSDTIVVTMKGDQTLNIEVEPYYMIRNAQFSASGRNVTATFKAEKIINDAGAKDIERVNFYVNKTQFVDFRSNVASDEIDGSEISDLNSISMNVTVPNLVPEQNYVFARVGIKIQGVEDMIFSEIKKIEL